MTIVSKADQSVDCVHLRHAARLAMRGHGGAEPNPMVGCVIVKGNAVVGWGYHRRCGGPHAEVEALRRAGEEARNAVVYVTLEPCNHHGRTPPCSEALIRAGVGSVVYAVADPHPEARGGAERLREAGIDVRKVTEPLAVSVSRPFIYRVKTGLPWIIAKWAQSLDGKIATRSGRSQWISSDRSRRMVHRERGRVDAILTGIGTVRADDPLLTPRARSHRRRPLRVVVDRDLEIPRASRLLSSAAEWPLVVACGGGAAAGKVAAIQAAGSEVMTIPTRAGKELDLEELLRRLSARGVATVLVEAGPGLVGSLLRQSLVCEIWSFIAPILMGDAEAPGAASGFSPELPADAMALQWEDVRRRGPDVLVRAVLPTAAEWAGSSQRS